jgi:hypothetical protein
LSDLTFGGGMYVAIGGWNIIASADATNWTTAVSVVSALSFFRVAYGQGTFVIAADSAIPESVLMTSANGLDWTRRNLGTTHPFVGVTFGNGNFVAVGGCGEIFTSQNGVDWTNRNSGTTLDIVDVAYGRGTFVAVGASGLILQSAHFGPPLLTGRRADGSNAFEISIEAESGSSLALQTSSNAVDWSDAAAFTNTSNVIAFRDSTSADASRRFYRTISR